MIGNPETDVSAGMWNHGKEHKVEKRLRDFFHFSSKESVTRPSLTLLSGHLSPSFATDGAECQGIRSRQAKDPAHRSGMSKMSK